MEPPRLTQLISRASRGLTRHGDAALKPLGFRYAQVPVIALLRRDGQLTQKALAAAAGIEQPSMAELLARMDRDGIVRRTPHPHDARSHLVTLADDESTRLDQAQARLAELEQRATAGLSVDETALLQQLLLRVVDNLDRSDEAAADGALGTD